MKQKLLILLTVFSMCGLVACGGEKTNDANAGGNNGEPVVTAEATAEPTKEPSSEAEPTEVPVVEATTEPTVEPTPEPTPDPYPGIDMNPDLLGKEWLKTFNGVFEEPKVVIFNDETGRKQIVEPDDLILVTDENDVLALYEPEGYAMTGLGGFETKDEVSGEGYEIFYLDFEKMSEKDFWKPMFMISYEGTEFMIKIEIQMNN